MRILITLSLTLVMAVPGGIQAQSHLIANVLQTRDAWRSVKTNNLFVIGDADAESLRQVAVWLEFFHSAFASLISRSVLNSTVPTTVVVFRDESSFLPFKPLYQGKPANVSGYFQPGDDVNYIALSLDRSERDPFATAFHEYVHLHLRENLPGIPLWLNEGLAEFYGSLKFSEGEAVLGAPINAYVGLLRSAEMLPLRTLFSVDNKSPHYNEQDKTGIFYGQSWALVHYLMLADGSQRQEQFKRFLQLVSTGDSADRAIEQAFGMSLSAVEKGLQDYVRRGEFTGQRIAIGNNPDAYNSYTALQRSSVSAGEADYYLGDLLMHINRESDAERYFQQAISLEPGLTPAYASLGLLRVRQRRYAEAKKYLQKATTSPQSFLIHYLYAYSLSREGITPTGEYSGYSAENVVIMREQLQRSIKLAPEFAAAYHLLALVDLVTDQHLDEAETMAERAQQLTPKAPYSMLLAQIYVRRGNQEAARRVLEPLTRNDNASIRTESQNLLDWLNKTATKEGLTRANPSRGTVKLSDAVIAEPVQAGQSRVIAGGAVTNEAIRDGKTIDNSGPMPTVDEVLARYVEALGGAAAIKAVNSRVTRGRLDIPGVSRDGSFEEYAQAPNKTLTVLQAYPMGTVRLGYNGITGWMKNASPLRALKGVELGPVQLNSDLFGSVRLKSMYAKVSLLGKSKIGYREIYVLELQPSSGPSERLSLDAETFLPVRVNTFRTNGPQTAPVEIYLDDWRTVDGIKLPFNISQSFPTQTLVFTVKEVQQNVPLAASLFEAPPKP